MKKIFHLAALAALVQSTALAPNLSNVGIFAPLGVNVVNVEGATDSATEANFHLAVRTAPSSGACRTVVYVPEGVRCILSHNTANDGTLAKPYVDYWIDGELVCGTPLGDGSSAYFDDSQLTAQATTNYIWGKGGITLSNNAVALSLGGTAVLFVGAQSGTKFDIRCRYIKASNTNQTVGQPALFFAGNGTEFNIDVDELANDVYDIFWVNGTTGHGSVKARLWQSYGQAWEFTSAQLQGSYHFYFETIQGTTNSPVPIAEADFHMFDMVDGIHAKGNLINCSSNRFTWSPIAGNGSGVLDCQRIVKTGTTTNAAIYGRNFTLLNCHVECGTNYPVAVIGANFRMQNCVLEATGAAATNTLFAAAAQTVTCWNVMTNKVKHQNVTTTGQITGY